MSTLELAVWSWILAGIFQFGVAPVWRIELHGGLIRKRFGWAGFRRFGLAFPVVRVSRMLLIVPISLSDAGTPPVHPAVAWILVLGPMPPIPWLAHSIRKCLPFQCAIGADHFVRGARGSPVTRGIFKYIGDPMHAVILPAPCQPGLL
jgi:hypothetical protein